MLLTLILESFSPRPQALCAWEGANSATRPLAKSNFLGINYLCQIYNVKIAECHIYVKTLLDLETYASMHASHNKKQMSVKMHHSWVDHFDPGYKFCTQPKSCEF